MNKGGGLLRDLQNIQSEIGYTTDDSYLYNYKNKEKDLERLLYKLSKYEKNCKLNKKSKKKHKQKNSQKIITKQKKSENTDNTEEKVVDNTEEKIVNNTEEKVVNNTENIQTGGMERNKNIPSIIFIPVLGSLLFENNYIKLNNNENVVNDLLLYQANHIINLLELFCVINIIHSYISNKDISIETIFVSFIVYITRIIVNLYKCNEHRLNTTLKFNNFIVLLLFILPLFIFLYNESHYSLKHNLFLCFSITICFLPYFRLLYNKLNTFDYRNALYINIIEKIICGIIFYIVITNDFNLDNMFNYINSTHKNNTFMTHSSINNFNSKNNNNNDILLNNFKKIFAK